MNVIYGLLGVVILLLVLGDVVKTTLSAKGSGLVSGFVANTLWAAALGLHRRWTNHYLLSFMGTIILVAIIGVWTFLLWLGWSLFFLIDPTSVVLASDGGPATHLETFYFTGYILITLGNGEFRPDGTFWQLATLLATTTGFFVVTLAITFLLSVVPSVATKRQTASYISSLGRRPQDIVLNQWNGSDGSDLVDHVPNLLSSLSYLRQAHQAFPVIHYFHSTDSRTAFALRLAALEDALNYLEHGLEGAEDVTRRLQPLQVMLTGLLDVLEQGFIDPQEDAPPPPPLEALTERGLNTVPKERFAEAIAERAAQRRLLWGFICKDGWEWQDIWEAQD